jgi:cell wall-associated NlpC family hydrolase
MTTRADIVAEARKYLGTRWLHQGRASNGMDCLGLCLCVAHNLKLSDFESTDYGRIPLGDKMRAVMDEHMDRVVLYQPGDVLLMRFETDPQHLAIVTDYGMIHAYAQARKVVEHVLSDTWKSRIVAAYSFRGLE